MWGVRKRGDLDDRRRFFAEGSRPKTTIRILTLHERMIPLEPSQSMCILANLGFSSQL